MELEFEHKLTGDIVLVDDPQEEKEPRERVRPVTQGGSGASPDAD